MTKLGEVFKEVNSRNNQRDFSDNVRLNFFKPVDGKTRLLFLSDEIDSDDGVPSLEFYKSYKIGNTHPYERAYVEGDTFDPAYLKILEENDRKPNPAYMSHKGFGYIFNLTAYNAKKVLEKKDSLTKADFNKDANETKAAKAYMKDDKYDDEFEGFMVYNFNTTILNALLDHKQMMEEDGEDEGFRTYVFDLMKTGEKLNTSYSLTSSTPYEDLDQDIRSHIEGFIIENQFSDFDFLIDRKRYESEDSIPEEASFADMETEEEETEEALDTNW